MKVFEIQRALPRSILALTMIVVTPNAAPAQVRGDFDRLQCTTILAARSSAPVTYLDQDKIKVAANAVDDRGEGRYAMYSVSVDAAGVGRTETRSTNISAESARRIGNAILESIIPGTRDVKFQVLIQPGSQKQSIRAAAAFSCAPILLNRSQVQNAGGVLLRQFPGIARAEITVGLQFDKNGEIVTTRTIKSSGYAQLDGEVTKMVRQVGRFENISTLPSGSWSYMVALVLTKRK